MKFLLIVGSSLLGGSRTHDEIFGSATTICALAWMEVKTAFLGPNATLCLLVLLTLCTDCAPPARHSLGGMYEPSLQVGVAPPQPVARQLPTQPPFGSSASPLLEGLLNGCAPLYCLPGPCRRDQQGAPGRKGRSVVYRSYHWWTRWNTITS